MTKLIKNEDIIMKKISILISVIVMIAFGCLYAGDVDRVGTTSGVQLLVPVGARSIGLGGASLGTVTGAEAIYWNPGGLAYKGKSEFLVNHMQYIADINMNYLAVSYSNPRIGAFGFHIKSFDFGDIEETTEEHPDGTGVTYSPTFVVTGVTYGRLITDRISAGATFKLIYEGVLQTSASTIAFDLGVQYSFNDRLRVGVVMKNVGGKLQYDGANLERRFPLPSTSLKRDEGPFRGVSLASDIPSIFSFGAAYTANINEENVLTFSAAFSNFNDSSDQLYGGVEYAFKDFFFLRGGYNYEPQTPDDQIFGASFGFGAKIPVGTFEIDIDYAFRQVTDYFDSNNIFTIKIGI
ncbi:MAG: hypothetical protein D6732_08290 [Methanobacteriota archaeon]|nr:MAG: hypothetical protein D6732_08290 [Euryarchaeota archaeon]